MDFSAYWMCPPASVSKAGILPNLDAIETHAYDDGVFTPEENDTAGKLLSLDQLVRKHNRGKPLPIYVTERGVMGSGTTARQQAAIMTRSCISPMIREIKPLISLLQQTDRQEFARNRSRLHGMPAPLSPGCSGTMPFLYF
jgi:hypothetical protein